LPDIIIGTREGVAVQANRGGTACLVDPNLN
jgi:hypothetical protein